MFYDGPVLNLCNFLGRAVFLFSNVKPKRQELILKRTFKSKNFFACVFGFVGGHEMGGAASLRGLSVIVIIFSFSFFRSVFVSSRKV